MEFKNVGEAVESYVALRDELQAWMKERDAEEREKKDQLEQIEVWLLQMADNTGVESFKTQYGTAYKTFDEHYRIQDWDSFIQYVKDTDNFQLIQKRVTKSAAKEIHNETGELPIGLDYFKEAKMHVRRPDKGSSDKGGEAEV